MPIWDRLKSELDRAGKAAQTALDEGRVRLEAFRSRQLADKAAQALGYAVYRARKAGGELDDDSYARLSGTIAGHEGDVARYEQQLRDLGLKPDAPGTDPSAGMRGAAEAGDAAGETATSTPSSGATPPPGAPGV
jgi:hypothetical protein